MNTVIFSVIILESEEKISEVRKLTSFNQDISDLLGVPGLTFEQDSLDSSEESEYDSQKEKELSPKDQENQENFLNVRILSDNLDGQFIKNEC